MPTVNDLLRVLEAVPANTEMFAHAEHRLYRIARARTLRTNLRLLDEWEKNLTSFTTKFAGKTSRWQVAEVGTKNSLLTFQ
jgi:hypothetical protein